jgi:site-specific DNA-methyltransferase (adenine-specific)
MVELLHGDCLERLQELPDCSVDACVTDPPYGLSFMGKKWDYDVPGEDIWRECLRVLKPGGHLLAFAGTRTQHRMAVRIEDAGFEIRDMIAWVYGSGFPKSHNLKGEWDGWGTALKPALEPITVARKPFKGTVANNVLTHGTSAINIDGCRISTDEKLGRNVTAQIEKTSYSLHDKPGVFDNSDKAGGRWPANLIHDGSDEVTELFPQNVRGAIPGTQKIGDKTTTNRDNNVSYAICGYQKISGYKEEVGSAARFFYCAKASKRDRDEGCEGLDERPSQKMGDGLKSMVGHPSGNNGNTSTQDRKSRNHHPTVKPTDLMRYLCRLVTPPGGIVLDPFMGSGSTGKAAVLEGFRFIGIEREAEYIEIARGRIQVPEQVQEDLF